MSATAREIGKVGTENPVAGRLGEVLLDSYALMLTTQVYHWNVEGPQFYSLHEAFEGQYRDLFEAVDELA